MFLSPACGHCSDHHRIEPPARRFQCVSNLHTSRAPPPVGPANDSSAGSHPCLIKERTCKNVPHLEPVSMIWYLSVLNRRASALEGCAQSTCLTFSPVGVGIVADGKVGARRNGLAHELGHDQLESILGMHGYIGPLPSQEASFCAWTLPHDKSERRRLTGAMPRPSFVLDIAASHAAHLLTSQGKPLRHRHPHRGGNAVGAYEDSRHLGGLIRAAVMSCKRRRSREVSS